MSGASTHPITDHDVVTLCEVWPRDGIQGWPHLISTADKLRVINAIADAGVNEIDATAFVPAATVPQFVDAEDVLRGLPEGLTVRVLAINIKGVERALAAQAATGRIDIVGFPISASESHNRTNLRRDHAARLADLQQMVALSLDAGLEPLLGIATAFGCPIEGVVPSESVLNLVQWAADHGVSAVMLGDTTGMANPRQVGELFGAGMGAHPNIRFVAHFHDNRGAGIANTLAAIDAGVRVVDSCLGGLGGEPAVVEQGQAGELGNVSSEDLVGLLDGSGIRTGIDPAALVRAGELVEDVLGRRLRSQVLRAGLVAR